MSVFCECCVLSGRSLCVGLITRPRESYRMWCVWVREAAIMRRPWRTWGFCAMGVNIASVRDKRVWSIGGTTLTADNRSTQKKKPSHCHFAHHKSHMSWLPFIQYKRWYYPPIFSYVSLWCYASHCYPYYHTVKHNSSFVSKSYSTSNNIFDCHHISTLRNSWGWFC
jgi:hypothetical protein